MKIEEILKVYRSIAVVGLSSRPWRPSYAVAQYLQENGYQIAPVNPNETEVLGQEAFPSLEDVPHPIDIVNVFRRSEFVPGIVESAIAVGARVVWMQQGVFHREAGARAADAGLEVVMDRCILTEHQALR